MTARKDEHLLTKGNYKMNINEKVAEQIASAGNEIAERVINLLAEKDKEKRVLVLVQAIGELDTMNKELTKIKADQLSFDSEGKPVSETWSKAKLDERNSKTGKRDKLEAAINLALEKNDFGALFNRAKNDKPETVAD